MKNLVNISSELVPELARKINRNLYHTYNSPFPAIFRCSLCFQDLPGGCQLSTNHCVRGSRPWSHSSWRQRAGASVQSFQRVHDLYRERDLTKHDIDPCQKFRIFISGLFLWYLPSCQTNAERLLHDRVCAAACSSQIWEHCKYLGRFVVQPRIWTGL